MLKISFLLANAFQSGKKKAFSFLLTTFLIVACANQTTQVAAEPTKGILWEISKAGVESSYLFGTMHSEDPRVTTLAPPVEKAFKASSRLILEMLLDKDSTRSVMQVMYFDDGKTLKQVIGEPLFQQSVKALADKGLPENLVLMMKPWAVFTILNMPDQKTGKFLDATLYEAALASSKDVVGLETALEQAAVFNDMDIAIQVSLLKSTLEHATDMSNILEETLQVYLSRDLDAILALNDKYIKLVEPEIGDIFTDRLIIRRNKLMAERMSPYLSQGNAFVAVGALHLPGEQGLLALLQKAGYQVKPRY